MSCEIKFNEDEFLSHFFRKGEKVEVNAEMLQKYIMENRKRDAELQQLETANDILSSTVKSQRDKIVSLRLQREPKYSLDLTA